MYTSTITLHLNQLPRFVKICPRCNNASYENSGCFRVNANGKRLDIWLICRCSHCKTIWNLSVCERVDRATLHASAYAGYLANDRSMVLQHVFDPVFLQKNRAILDLETLDLLAYGNLPPEGEAAELRLCCDYSLPLPLGRVIALVLGVSISRVKRMQEDGMLLPQGDLRKTRAGTTCAFVLQEGWRRTNA